MTRADLITAVKGRLDEFTPFAEPTSLVALSTSDVKPMNSIIENILARAADSVLMVVPLYLVQTTLTDITSAVTGATRMTDDTEVGLHTVPSDFLRLHTAKFDTWRRSVNETHKENEEMYRIQRNQYTRGRNEKPCVCINNGKFEIYSLTFPTTETTHCEKFTYIPRTSESAATFEDSVAPLIILEAARVCLATFGNTAGVKLMAEEEKTWLQSKV